MESFWPEYYVPNGETEEPEVTTVIDIRQYVTYEWGTNNVTLPRDVQKVKRSSENGSA